MAARGGGGGGGRREKGWNIRILDVTMQLGVQAPGVSSTAKFAVRILRSDL